MHLGKFHAVIDKMDKFINASNLNNLLANLINSLTAVVNTPNNPEVARVFKTHYELLRNTLIESPFNKLNPSEKNIVDEIGGNKYLGVDLLHSIDDEIDANNLAPSIALSSLQNIQNKTAEYIQTISIINREFTNLKVEYTDLEPDETEIGIIIPKSTLEANLKSFAKELRDYGTALNVFEEIIGVDTNSTSLKLVSSSDWQLYLGAVPLLLLVFSSTLKQLASILKSVVELKQSWKDLTKKDVPQKITDELKSHIDTQIDEKIRYLAESIVDEYYKKDKARANELKNHMTQSLKFFASKMDIGVQIEFRIEPPTEEKKVELVNNTQITHNEIADSVNRNSLEIAEFGENNTEPLKLLPPDFTDSKDIL